MTLNLMVHNMVATDSQVTIQQIRTSDTFKKSEIFSREHYHGVLLGTGDGLMALDAFSFVRGSSERTLDDLMASLETYRKNKKEQEFQRGIEELRGVVRLKYSEMSSAAEREKMIATEFADQSIKLDERSRERRGALYIVAHDKQKNLLRKYGLSDAKGASLFNFDLVPINADGTGGDLAGAYLNPQVSGIDWEKITLHYTFYLLALGCAVATANSGVGGYMHMVAVNNIKAEEIDPLKVNAAVRVCSKQTAGDISKQEAIRLVAEIYEGKADYPAIVRALDITENDLLYAPAQLHQDVSRFNQLMMKS